MRRSLTPVRQTALYRELTRVAAGAKGRDAPLAAASLGFARYEMQQVASCDLGAEMGPRGADAARDGRERHAAALCALPAHSLSGHRARALAFCIWDDGELARRATADSLLEDRLLWAVLSGLAR